MSFLKLETPLSARRLSGICMGLGAALALGLSSWAYGQDCGVGDVSSAEACLGDDDEDTVNGGCNSDPDVFEAANLDGSMDGTVSTFLFGGAPRRDTDWYLITQADLNAADADGNGVIQIRSTLSSEFDGVTFFISFEPDCDTLGFPGSIGFSGAGCAGGDAAVATLIIDGHPDGIVVFVSSGLPDGTPINEGFECFTGNNDYLLTLESVKLPTSCAPGSGPCGEPNGSPGCEDPECCALVCDVDPLCCILDWDQTCADTAIGLDCAPLPCPVSFCDAGVCTLSQSQNSNVDAFNQIACGNVDGTTENGWARCYNLVAEGVPEGENLTINSVTFGIQQATIDGINVDVILYLDCNGCPPGEPNVDATVLATQSLVVNMSDVGDMITVNFPAGTVVPAGSDLIVEIANVDDGTEEPFFAFRTMSNDIGQCGPTYLRAADCGFAGWTDLADIGDPPFVDTHMIQTVSATVGGVVTVECAKIPESCGKGAGSCGEPNGTPGCDDELCCAAVCEIDPICCLLEWDQTCVDIAVGIGCAAGPGQPTDLATGPSQNSDGYLRIGSDGYGSYAVDFAGGVGNGDTFNPVGAFGAGNPTFSQNFSVYRQAQGEGIALTVHDGLLATCANTAMSREITALSVISDTNGDEVDDTRVDTFDVTSDSGMDTSWQLTQHVFNQTLKDGSLVAIVTFDFVITNNGPPVGFILQRHLDIDSLFGTNDFADDNVGTGTNGAKGDRFIYQGEFGSPETHITLSSPSGDVYYGGKQGVNPDPGDPNCPPYDFGTDTEICDNFGTPDCWKNHIAGVGYNTDGDSGPNIGGDGFIGMEIPVSLAAEGVTTVSVMLTYGAKTPGGDGGPECPWDLDRGGFVGAGDLLLLLADWGNPYGAADLLDLLAAWGACP